LGVIIVNNLELIVKVSKVLIQIGETWR